MAQFFLLVDCNNFYVSCERVFNPKLNKKAVVILSNNDGCVIARSNEAKALGIPMGAPYFEYQELIKRHNVIVYSSNFSLYGDMSARVMSTIAQLSPNIEIYSIDEAFIKLNNLHHDLDNFAYILQQKVKQWTGIPISIGIGPTKTLAKLANKYAKKNPACKGIFKLTNIIDIYNLLHTSDVSDIWGIGRRYAKLLYHNRIKTCLQLISMDDVWIRKNLTISGLKTVWELRGIPCIDLQEEQEDNKTISCTRSFRNPLIIAEDLQQAISFFTIRAAEKLRAQESLATAIYVFVTTNRFNEEYYSNGITIALSIASSYTPDLLASAQKGLAKIYRPGYRYKRAGVILLGIIPQIPAQLYLFTDPQLKGQQNQLMQTVDAINDKWGSHMVTFAYSGKKQLFIGQRSYQSPCFTTKWQELLTIK